MRPKRAMPWLIAAIAIACPAPHWTAADDAAAVDFNRDIRPILSETCYQCHGPDAKKRKADLRLDTRAGLFRSADGSTVVVPARPDESELWLRIASDDPETRMPPPKAGKPLVPAQADLVRRWIEQGAVWKGHWSFIPAARPAAPQPSRSDTIDRFLRARLDVAGLEPSPEADRPTLIRRLSLDLIGLPPTPEEVDAFVRDERPDAYERLVDRLLASPHYGERMAALLARPGPVRRHPGLSQRQPRQHLALPRLRDPRVQRQQAVRPVHDRAARRGPATAADRRDPHRLRLQPAAPDHPGGRGAGQGIHRQVRRRPGAQRLDRLDGRDHGLRRVPRPQV